MRHYRAVEGKVFGRIEGSELCGAGERMEQMAEKETGADFCAGSLATCAIKSTFRQAIRRKGAFPWAVLA
jgi:hypothetical protein